MAWTERTPCDCITLGVQMRKIANSAPDALFEGAPSEYGDKLFERAPSKYGGALLEGPPSEYSGHIEQ